MKKTQTLKKTRKTFRSFVARETHKVTQTNYLPFSPPIQI